MSGGAVVAVLCPRRSARGSGFQHWHCLRSEGGFATARAPTCTTEMRSGGKRKREGESKGTASGARGPQRRGGPARELGVGLGACPHVATARIGVVEEGADAAASSAKARGERAAVGPTAVLPGLHPIAFVSFSVFGCL